MKVLQATAVGVVAAALAHAARAQAPLGTAFTFQGELRAAGTPATGLHDLRFRLYDAAAEGAQVGATLCADNVIMAAGRFTVSLDFGQQFTGLQRFLEIDVRADTGLDCGSGSGFVTLAPRQALTAAPGALFALGSRSATQLDGQPAQFYQNASNLSGGALPDARLEGTYSGALTLSNAGNAFTGAFTGSGSGLTELDAAGISQGLVGPTFGGIGLDTSTAAAGSMLYTSDIGVWSLLVPGVDGQVLTSSGGVPTWANAAGLTLPFEGSAGVPAPNAAFKATNTGGGAGVWGQAFATTGLAYGGYFNSSSTDGRGIFAQATAATGFTYAGRFGNFSTSGVGVSGVASAASGLTYGGHFQSLSPGGYGLYAEDTANTGGNVGVGGRTNDLAAGYGVVSYGRFAATGTKAFRIDHPADPENKYLLHYCSEGPEPYNIYKGRVTTDARGFAWAELPEYFESINRDADYQLTVIDGSDDFILAKVSREAADHRFQIRTSKPNVTVCWEVKGVRNDPFVRMYGAPVEMEKRGAEKGTYQHPELYGQLPEKRLNFEAGRARAEPEIEPAKTAGR
jgi:hypothetical protein